MRKIQEILRLRASGLSARQIAASVGSARSTVGECLRRAEEAGVSWPLAQTLDETTLERRLYPPPPAASTTPRAAPDFAAIHQELRSKGVTLFLLWQEYQVREPDGYQYSRFCDLYREWCGKLDLVMRQVHRAGEKLFVDYAGPTLPIVDASTGEIRAAQLFVAVLGASSYTYVEATWTQSLPDWLGAHVRALEFFQGCPSILTPDNLRPAVSKAHRYEPDLNPAYQAFADHYGIAVVPARVRRPRDKAKAEAGVLLVVRWILARLRHHTLFSLHEANARVAELRGALNARPFRKLPGSRLSQFEALDRPALRPLPATRYEFAEFKKARVNLDYHVDFDGHYYSVPYVLVHQVIELRVTATTVEGLHKGQRVASHVRSGLKGRHTTVAAHMPPAHQHQAEWTPQRLERWGAKIGPGTAQAITAILGSRTHPEQGFRAALGVLRLEKSYGAQRLEAACLRAVALRACRYKSIESMLKKGLDRVPPAATTATLLPIDHANVRGPGYYH